MKRLPNTFPASPPCESTKSPAEMSGIKRNKITRQGFARRQTTNFFATSPPATGRGGERVCLKRKITNHRLIPIERVGGEAKSYRRI